MKKIIGILIVLIGLIVCMLPAFMTKEETQKHEQVIETLTEYKEMDKDPLLQALEQYNQEIYENKQTKLKDPFEYETTAIDLSEYGIQDDLVGSIWIPRMDIELPLYWGASEENMDKGAALLGQTSFPMNQINTNAVIAAHRGHGLGNPMFRDIQSLQTGDEVYITLPWTILKYSVREAKPVAADAIDEVKIQEGKDMITLQTCHPYPESYERYIVYCDFVSEESTIQKEEIQKTVTVTKKQSNLSEGEQKSNTRIWWEEHLPYIGFGLFVLLSIFTIWNQRRRV